MASQKGQVVLQVMVPTSIGYLLGTIFLIQGTLPTTGQLWDHAMAAAIVAVAAALVQDLVPKPMKEALVFWRMRDRLPGHRAFRSETMRDRRIDTTLVPNLGELQRLSAPEQNRAWYRAYQAVCERPAICHYSFRYLAWRDTAALLATLGLLSIPLMLWVVGTAGWRGGIILASTCALLCILSTAAARASSRELIVSVIASMAGGGVQK